jgi:hypothetical protein
MIHLPLAPDVAARLLSRIANERMRGPQPVQRQLATPAPGETAVHTAADAHVAHMAVAIRYAFARGWSAINQTALRNATTKQQYLDATAGAAPAVKAALLEVLPTTLLACLAAGGNAGLEIVNKEKSL